MPTFEAVPKILPPICHQVGPKTPPYFQEAGPETPPPIKI